MVQFWISSTRKGDCARHKQSTWGRPGQSSLPQAFLDWRTKTEVTVEEIAFVDCHSLSLKTFKKTMELKHISHVLHVDGRTYDRPKIFQGALLYPLRSSPTKEAFSPSKRIYRHFLYYLVKYGLENSANIQLENCFKS
jgi:hypothetical protein